VSGHASGPELKLVMKYGKREIETLEVERRDIAAGRKRAPSPALAAYEKTLKEKLYRYRAEPGPMPTLGIMARQGGGWMWLCCPSRVCLHRVAAHLAIFVQQFGEDFPMDEFRARLWCTMCGTVKCQTDASSWAGSTAATEAFPEARGYYAHMEKLEREGAFRWLVVDRSTGRIRRERITAAQARSLARRYSRDRPMPFQAMHFDQWRLTMAQRWR